MTDAEQALFGIDKLNIARSSIPAVTHIGLFRARPEQPASLQPDRTVRAPDRPRVLINSSFNVDSEPIARRKMRSAVSWAPSST
jgi:carbamoyltransferase